MNKVDIVIVNWNTGTALRKLIPQCLNLEQINKVIIVDNNSNCNDLSGIEDIKDQKLIIIRNSNNLGFGAACNIGAINSDAPYILFLNPDVEIQSNRILVDCIKIMNHHSVDVLGVKQIDNYGNTQRSCANFPTLRTLINESLGLNKLNSKIFPGFLLTNWDHQEDRMVDHVIGSFYFLKRQTLIKSNFFDERYFVYYEDLDLSKKIKNNGGLIYYTSEIQILHEGGGSSKSVKASRIFYSMRSRVMYTYKHLGKAKGGIYLISALTIEKFIRILFFRIKKDAEAISQTQEAYKMYNKYIKSNLRK